MLGPGQAQADADDPGDGPDHLAEDLDLLTILRFAPVSVLSPRSNLTRTSCSSRQSSCCRATSAHLAVGARGVLRLGALGDGAAGGGRWARSRGFLASRTGGMHREPIHASILNVDRTDGNECLGASHACGECITDVGACPSTRGPSGESVTSPLAGSARRAETRSRRDAGRGSSPASDAHPPPGAAESKRSNDTS